MSCKTINIDLANVPPVPLQIGVAGESAFRTITFDASKWGADYPDATYTVVYRRSDGYLYPVLVNASADAIVWNPTGTDTAVSGNGQLEVRLLDGETIGKTIIMQTYVAPSLSGDESEPSTPAPDWVNDVADDADRAEGAVSHYPKIVNGVWFVWDATQSEFVSTGINAQGEDGVSPTVTVTAIEGGHRVTITDADGAHTFDVMDGEDGEGGGSAANAVLYTPQSLTDSQKAQARTNVGAGTYSKPASGIPASDLADGVIPDVSDKVDKITNYGLAKIESNEGNYTITVKEGLNSSTNAAVVSTGTFATAMQQAGQALAAKANTADVYTKTEIDNKGYQTAQDVQTAISGVRQLPAVTASDNGKFLRVVNGAWAAAQYAPTTPRVAMTSADSTPTLEPNKLYVFPEMASLTPSLATPTDATIVNEYHFMFTSGATAATLTIPATINQPDGFTVEANHVYEVSIMEGCMTAQGWAVSGS